MGPPPPSSDSYSSGSSFDSELGTLLSSIVSGDTDTAQSAATALQKILENAGVSTSSTASDTDADASATTSTGKSDGQSDFLSTLQGILDAVANGDTASAKSGADALIAGMQQNGPPPGGPPRGGPGSPGNGSDGGFAQDVSTLLSSVESGDTETAQTAAQALQQQLDSLGQSGPSSSSTGTSDSTDGHSILANLKSLLAAIGSGDMATAKSTADTMISAMNGNSGSSNAGRAAGPPPGRGMAGPPPTEGSGDTALSSLQSALDTLKTISSSSVDTSSSTSSSSSTFIQSLENLLEAMSSGTDVNGKLKAVLDAYSSNASSAA